MLACTWREIKKAPKPILAPTNSLQMAFLAILSYPGNDYLPCILCPTRDWGGGHSHMSADIICLSIDPLFWCKSHTQWPSFSSQSTFNDPLFSLFQTFCQFLAKNGKFSSKVDQIYTAWPTFWKFTPKIAIFFPHLMNYFFLQNPTLNAAVFDFQ